MLKMRHEREENVKSRIHTSLGALFSQTHSQGHSLVRLAFPRLNFETNTESCDSPAVAGARQFNTKD